MNKREIDELKNLAEKGEPIPKDPVLRLIKEYERKLEQNRILKEDLKQRQSEVRGTANKITSANEQAAHDMVRATYAIFNIQ